jgi:hypothetical protein
MTDIGTCRTCASPRPPSYAQSLPRKLRPVHLTLLLAGALLILILVLGVSVWARSDERDVRCDKAKRAEAKAKGEDYSCVLQIPGHDRGH